MKSTTPATPKPEDGDSGRKRFPRSARLSQSGDFQYVRSHGRMVQGRFLRVSCAPSRVPEAPARFGIVTSKRIGGAVQRSLVRRRLREILRAMRGEIHPGRLIVIGSKRGAAEATFAELREEWLLLGRRLSIFRTLA